MWIKILLLFFVFSFLFKTDQSFNQDLGRHIKVGEIILQNFSIPKVNLFSYTNPDFPFINTHWLFGVIAFLFQKAGALQLFLILKVVVILISVWLTLKIIPEGKQVLLLPMGFIFLHVLRERTDLRPEIFSFLFTALSFFILEKFIRQKTRLIFLLPIIQIIWINTHIYFFVGLLLQFIFFSHLLFKRIGWHLSFFVLLASIFVSLLNPNGINGLLYPLNVNQNYGYSIVENQSMFLLENIGFRDSNFLFVKLSFGIILFSLVLSLIKKNFEVKNFLLSCVGLGLALLNVRSFPYLVFISLPAVLMSLPVFKSKRFTHILYFATGILLFAESYFYLSGDYYILKGDYHQNSLKFAENGQAALDFVLEKNLPQPIFNNFDIGSYIIYRGYPKYRVFVDGRPEAYPAQFFQSTYIPIQSDYQKFKEAGKSYGFKTVIFSHTDQTPWGQNFLQNIVKDPEWKIVYIDDFMVILVRDGVLGNLQSINLAEINSVNYKYKDLLPYLRLGIFISNMGYQTQANYFFQKAYQISPTIPILTGKKSPIFW